VTVARLAGRTAVCTLLASITFCTALGAPLKIVSGSAIEPAMKVLIPNFEAASGHRVVSDLDAAIGAVAARVQQGERADIVIVSRPQLDELERSGRVEAGSRTDLVKVGVGVFVRKGAAKPVIDTVDAFKRTMLAAKSIGYNDPAAGAPVSLYLLGLFEKIGIAAEVKPKSIAFKQRTERFGAVARGDVEIGFNQISEIIAVPEVDLVGPLPVEIQNYTLFAAGILKETKEPDAARVFIRFITSPEAQIVWKEKGFEAP
jgi:molybdate transport system substrate-binding protein